MSLNPIVNDGVLEEDFDLLDSMTTENSVPEQE